MQATHRGIVGEIEQRRGMFALAFVAFFVVSYAFLFAVGATPDPAGTTAGTGDTSAAAPQDAAYTVPAQPTTPEQPTRIVAKSINLDVSVANPASTDIDALDQTLLTGAARYPTSALLGVDGTVLLFGHSSYLPIVHNQAYKTFDGIQNLKTGDIISVYSAAHEYQYQVTSVRIADATQDVIDLSQSGRHLTLVTCDSFASKQHRFVVTADLAATFGAN